MIAQLTTHLWQSTFFAAAAGLMTLAFRGNRAQIRYWLWLSASFKFFIPFALLISLGRYVDTRAPSVQQFATALPAVSYTVEQFGKPLSSERPALIVTAPATTPWIHLSIIVGWLIGFAAIAVIRLRTWRRIRAAVSASAPVSIPTAVPTAVNVRTSPGVLEPGVVGLVTPILLLPEGIAEHLTPSELRAVLAHELCHIHRRDNLFASIHMIVEAIFWFHPLVWWIGARLVEERERACDEEVLSMGNQPDIYAAAILNVCKLYVKSPLACVSGIAGAGIRRRIELIMTNRAVHRLNRAKKLLLAGSAGLALVGPVAIGLVIGVGKPPAARAQSSPRAAVAPQILNSSPMTPKATPQAPPPKTTTPLPAAPKPAFDVVSIRRCMPGDELKGTGGRGGRGGRGPRLSPGRLRIQCLSVTDMIDIAYLGPEPLLNRTTLPGDRRWLKGGPDWMYSDWYTVDAEMDNPVANEPNIRLFSEAGKVMARMLQPVLEDRFQLKIHRDAEEAPMYSMTVAKGGLKLKPTGKGGCVPHDPASGTYLEDMFPPGKTPMCTQWIHTDGPDWVIDGAGQGLQQIAQMLSGVFNTHVFDRSGVDGLFTYHLQFAHDETTPGSFPPEMEILHELFPATDIPPGASIFTALDRMGLKLERVKGPRGIVIVDSVERPSEN